VNAGEDVDELQHEGVIGEVVEAGSDSDERLGAPLSDLLPRAVASAYRRTGRVARRAA